MERMLGLATLMGTLWIVVSAGSYVFRKWNIESDEHVLGRSKKDRIKTNWNVFGLIFNIYDFSNSIDWKVTFGVLTPSTPLQKEIREEERQIKELKAQKRDMERLEALKAEREALFEEVKEEPDYSVDPMPILRQQFSERQPIEYELDAAKVPCCSHCKSTNLNSFEFSDGLYYIECFDCKGVSTVKINNEELFKS